VDFENFNRKRLIGQAGRFFSWKVLYVLYWFFIEKKFVPIANRIAWHREIRRVFSLPA